MNKFEARNSNLTAMDLTSITTIKSLLEKNNAKALKTMGQNFLIEKSVLQKIITAAPLNKKDTVLEIGPGLGTLTRQLAEQVKTVIAIEKDQAMAQILQETTKDYQNITIIQSDVLKTSQDALPNHYKLVANLPYYITSPIIRMFLESQHQPESMVLMVQKEVAQRICNAPPNMSILAVSVQFYATAKVICYVSKGCFWPRPNVDSAIISIIPHTKKPSTDPDIFFKIVKAGFLHPRKQLGNNLSEGLKTSKEEIKIWLAGYGLQSSQRAETLTIEEWTSLAKSYSQLET
jgi:16S rRNA (adenine1518-N6/adenine1519-N6)-dimethyltransferase